jgi:exosortase/archaeosortase
MLNGMAPLLAKLREHELVARVLLVPVFVGVCYLFDWNWLRVITAGTLVNISAAMGIPMLRLSADVIGIAGISAQIVVACTMIDAYFGAIPLLWKMNALWRRNLARMAAVFIGVCALNIVRLEAGFVAHTWGVPWWLAHEVVAGVAYFALYAFVLRERAWVAESPIGEALPVTREVLA